MLRWMPVALLLATLGVARLPARDIPPVQSGQFVQTGLAEWQQGTLDRVFVDGPVLRLQPGQTSGSYLSKAFQAPFGLNAAIMEWQATATAEQMLALELRSSIDGKNWTDWQAITPRAGSGGKSISQLFVLRPFTSWLQYRAHFEAKTGSPALAGVTLTYLNSSAGPALADITSRVPPSGPLVKTPPPPTVADVDWGAIPLGSPTERQVPRRIQLSEVRVPKEDPNSAATIRAVQWVATNLEHQDVVPYHFLLDGTGTIYQGAGSVTRKLSETPDGTVAIAVLADVEREDLSDATRSALAKLLGWVGDAYNLSPSRLDAAPDAPPQLGRLVPELRTAMDRAIVRSRTFFAVGNTALGTERVAVLNRTPDEAHVALTGISALGQERRSLSVPSGKRLDLTLNATIPVSGPVGIELLSDRPVEVERTQSVGREVLGNSGTVAPARVWYFGDGSSTEVKSSTVDLLNPQDREARAAVTLFPDVSAPVSQTLTLAPHSRQSIDLAQLLPGQHFGIKVVSNEPVVAERMAISTSGATMLASGTSELSRRWLFAEGSTVAGYTTTLALLNPWPQQIPVTLRVMSEDGTSLDRRYSIPGNQRTVLTLNDIVPDLPFAMDLTADRPIAAERLIQFDNGRGASAGPGASHAATRWDFVAGSTAKPAEEYLLILNPNDQPVGLDVAYITAGGRVEHRSHSVGAAARLTIAANSDLPNQPVLSAIVTADQPVVAERTIYVNSAEGRGGETSLGIPGN